MFFAALITTCVAVLRRRVSGDPTLAAAGLFGGVAVMVIGLSHDVLYHNAVALAFASLVGLVLASFVWPQGTTTTRVPLLAKPMLSTERTSK